MTCILRLNAQNNLFSDPRFNDTALNRFTQGIRVQTNTLRVQDTSMNNGYLMQPQMANSDTTLFLTVDQYGVFYLKAIAGASGTVTLSQLTDSTSNIRVDMAAAMNDTANAVKYDISVLYALTSALGDTSADVKAWVSSQGYLTSAVTSIKIVSNAAAYSITPTTATTTSGTYSIVPTGTSSQHVNGDGSLDNAVYIYSLVAGSNVSLAKSGGIYTITSTNTGGTITSISTTSGILGGTITTSGTIYLDSTFVPKWDDTLSGNRWLVTVNYLKSFGYGTGTVTSVGIVAGTGVSISGSPITTSGTMTVTSTGSLTQGSNITLSGSWPSYTISATSGSSGTVTSVGAVSGNTNIRIGGSTITSSGVFTFTPSESPSDSFINWIAQTYTLVAYPSSGLQLFSTNQNGNNELTSISTNSVITTYQPSLTETQIGWASTGASSIIYNDRWNGCYSTSSGGATGISSVYSLTPTYGGYSRYRMTTAASINTSGGINATATNVATFTGGSGFKYTARVSFPTYLTTERIFIGMLSSSGLGSSSTTDPSTWSATIGIAKDAGQSTFYFCSNTVGGTSSETSTGITPNSSDIYEITIEMSPFSSTANITLSDLSYPNSITVTVPYSSSHIPVSGTLIYPLIFINTGAVASAISIDFIKAGCIYY